MKIKVKPEDFLVEEITTIPEVRHGPFTLIKLIKRNWNTLDAIDYVARQLKLPRRDFARAGLKDRYAQSIQYCTVKGNIQRSITTENLSAIPVGHTDQPISPALLKGNRFSITLRSMIETEIKIVQQNAPHICKHGLVNYFDEQRFGSARHGYGFFARELMRTHYRGALKLLLCYSHKDEDKQERIFKRFCQDNWGAWDQVFKKTPSGYKKIIIALIETPRGYRQAIKTIDREFLNLYLLAYQSFLFNEIAREFIQQCCSHHVIVPYTMGSFVFCKTVLPENDAGSIKLPMLNEKTVLKDPLKPIIQSILEREGIQLKDFALRKMRFRGVRFKSFTRPLRVIPRDFRVSVPYQDELYPKKKKMTITFELPPGSYATLVIKRLMLS